MSKDRPLQLTSGWTMLTIAIVMFLLAVGLFIGGVSQVEHHPGRGAPLMIVAGLVFMTTLIACIGFVTLLPNEACLYTLFGAYVGTARDTGTLYS